MLRPRLLLVWVLALATIAPTAFGWRKGWGGKRLPASLATIDSLALSDLGGRHGVVFVFSPTTCRLKAKDFRILNELAKVPGLRVRGIAVVDAPPETPVGYYTDRFEVHFPVALDSANAWSRALAASRLESPMLVFVRDGRVQGMLWSDASLGLKGLPFHWEEFMSDSSSL